MRQVAKVFGGNTVQFRACAIDGPGGAGKSTLAKTLAEHTGATVISMDHFLLPPEKHRLSAVARNYDLDRFNHEVIGALIVGAPINYVKSSILDGNDGPSEKVKVPLDKPVIIDGIYSLEIRFRQAYDFSIFVDADKETLLRRATAIEGSSGSWLDKWLVGEETYLLAQDPMSAATLILDGAKPLPSAAQILELVTIRKSQASS